MRSGAMPLRPRYSSAVPTSAPTDLSGPEHWPFLDHEQLQRSRGRRFCLSCQWFQHLSHRCPSWRELLQHQQGWAPELG